MEAGISPIETYDFLTNAYPDMKVVQRDIYNAREKIKYQKLKGRTRIAALLHELEDAKDDKGEEKWNTARRRNPITKAGPLSDRTCPGTPRRMNRSEGTSMTSSDLSLRATRIDRHSRVNSSITPAFAGAGYRACGTSFRRGCGPRRSRKNQT